MADEKHSVISLSLLKNILVSQFLNYGSSGLDVSRKWHLEAYSVLTARVTYCPPVFSELQTSCITVALFTNLCFYLWVNHEASLTPTQHTWHTPLDHGLYIIHIII